MGTRHEAKIGFAEIHKVEKTGKIDEKQDSGRFGRKVILSESADSFRAECETTLPGKPASLPARIFRRNLNRPRTTWIETITKRVIPIGTPDNERCSGDIRLISFDECFVPDRDL